MTLREAHDELFHKGFHTSDFGREVLDGGALVDFRIYRRRTPVAVIDCKIWSTTFFSTPEILQANAEAVRAAIGELSISKVLEHCP